MAAIVVFFVGKFPKSVEVHLGVVCPGCAGVVLFKFVNHLEETGALVALLSESFVGVDEPNKEQTGGNVDAVSDSRLVEASSTAAWW